MNYRREGRGLVVASSRNRSRARTLSAGLAVELLERRRLLTDGPITVTAGTVSAAEGQPQTAEYATFTSGNPSAPASDFAATVQFGDGSSGAGTITKDAGGVFHVVGSHTYAEEATAQATVTVSSVDGATGSASNVRVSVGDAPLTAQSATFVGVEGLPAGGTVATFTDADPNATIADYTASISWGDGSGSAGMIEGSGTNPNGHTYIVVGNHTYSEEGAYAISVSISDTGGSSTTASSQAVVADAPVSLNIGTMLGSTAGTPLIGVVLGTVSDAVREPAGNYKLEIDWGDGTPSTPATVLGSGTSPSSLVILGTHTFALPGTYTGSVTIQDSGGSTAEAQFTTQVSNPTVNFMPLSATEGESSVGVPIAAISGQGGTTALASAYHAIIDWGDGSAPTAGLIDSAGTVLGSHRYVESGTYNLHLTIGDSGAPSLINTSTTITVRDIRIVLTGNLNPSSDHGLSNTDKVTNDSQPNFTGTSEPGSTVKLYAQSELQAAAPRVLVGQTAADASGHWSITTAFLPDGIYTITATAVDRNGVTTATTQLLPADGSNPLVIDTVGPKITDLFFDRLAGTMQVTFQDNLSGLNGPTLIDGANYRFMKEGSGSTAFLITSLTPTIPTTPTQPVVVTAAINGGQRLRGGRFLFTVRSGGITDIAGNALDGEYYGYFPSGNNKPGGDFSAEIVSRHNITFSPTPLNGFATPNNPPGTPASSFVIHRGRRPSQLGGTAQTAVTSAIRSHVVPKRLVPQAPKVSHRRPGQ